jgi:hypothetical protein
LFCICRSSFAPLESLLIFDSPDSSENPLPILLAKIAAESGTIAEDEARSSALKNLSFPSISYDNAGVPAEYKIYSYNTEGQLRYEITQFVKGTTLASLIKYPLYNLRGSIKEETWMVILMVRMK